MCAITTFMSFIRRDYITSVQVLLQKWIRCQRTFLEFGTTGLKRRLQQLTPDYIHPMVAARARQILNEFTLQDALAVGAGVAALYKLVRTKHHICS